MRAKVPYRKRKKRRGCGNGSGHGKTSTKGQKGQKSRSGVSYRAGFEGGQNPLYRRLPKRGFNNASFRSVQSVVNLGRVASLEEKEITPEVLAAHGLVKRNASVKVLGDGDVKKALTVHAHRFSGSAKAKIEKAGGKALLVKEAGTRGSKPETSVTKPAGSAKASGGDSKSDKSAPSAGE